MTIPDNLPEGAVAGATLRDKVNETLEYLRALAGTPTPPERPKPATFSNSHAEDKPEVGTIMPLIGADGAQSDKLELVYDGRGWMTRVKSEPVAIPEEGD